MDGHILLLSELEDLASSISEPVETPITLSEALRLDDLFGVPALYSPNLSQEEWDLELNGMIARSIASRAFIDGRLSPDDFACALAESGIDDPYQLEEQWQNGFSFLTGNTLA